LAGKPYTGIPYHHVPLRYNRRSFGTPGSYFCDAQVFEYEQ
jgi:hypothetical protein